MKQAGGTDQLTVAGTTDGEPALLVRVCRERIGELLREIAGDGSGGVARLAERLAWRRLEALTAAGDLQRSVEQGADAIARARAAQAVLLSAGRLRDEWESMRHAAEALRDALAGARELHAERDVLLDAGQQVLHAHLDARNDLVALAESVRVAWRWWRYAVESLSALRRTDARLAAVVTGASCHELFALAGDIRRVQQAEAEPPRTAPEKWFDERVQFGLEHLRELAPAIGPLLGLTSRPSGEDDALSLPVPDLLELALTSLTDYVNGLRPLVLEQGAAGAGLDGARRLLDQTWLLVDLLVTWEGLSGRGAGALGPAAEHLGAGLDADAGEVRARAEAVLAAGRDDPEAWHELVTASRHLVGSSVAARHVAELQIQIQEQVRWILAGRAGPAQSVRRRVHRVVEGAPYGPLRWAMGLDALAARAGGLGESLQLYLDEVAVDRGPRQLLQQAMDLDAVVRASGRIGDQPGDRAGLVEEVLRALRGPELAGPDPVKSEDVNRLFDALRETLERARSLCAETPPSAGQIDQALGELERVSRLWHAGEEATAGLDGLELGIPAPDVVDAIGLLRRRKALALAGQLRKGGPEAEVWRRLERELRDTEDASRRSIHSLTAAEDVEDVALATIALRLRGLAADLRKTLEPVAAAALVRQTSARLQIMAALLESDGPLPEEVAEVVASGRAVLGWGRLDIPGTTPVLSAALLGAAGAPPFPPDAPALLVLLEAWRAFPPAGPTVSLRDGAELLHELGIGEHLVPGVVELTERLRPVVTLLRRDGEGLRARDETRAAALALVEVLAAELGAAFWTAPLFYPPAERLLLDALLVRDQLAWPADSNVPPRGEDLLDELDRRRATWGSRTKALQVAHEALVRSGRALSKAPTDPRALEALEGALGRAREIQVAGPPGPDKEIPSLLGRVWEGMTDVQAVEEELKHAALAGEVAQWWAQRLEDEALVAGRELAKALLPELEARVEQARDAVATQRPAGSRLERALLLLVAIARTRTLMDRVRWAAGGVQLGDAAEQLLADTSAWLEQSVPGSV